MGARLTRIRSVVVKQSAHVCESAPSGDMVSERVLEHAS